MFVADARHRIPKNALSYRYPPFSLEAEAAGGLWAVRCLSTPLDGPEAHTKLCGTSAHCRVHCHPAGMPSPTRQGQAARTAQTLLHDGSLRLPVSFDRWPHHRRSQTAAEPRETYKAVGLRLHKKTACQSYTVKAHESTTW